MPTITAASSEISGEPMTSATRKFNDVIARGAHPVDIHNPSGGRGTMLKRVPRGQACDIPLRRLFPHDVNRVLVAGRCISGDHVAHSSYRVMPISMATGQAAGVCAALAAIQGKPPQDIPTGEVQKNCARKAQASDEQAVLSGMRLKEVKAASADACI